MEITFPGGVAVEARMPEFTIRTDQPPSAGGENSAPSPFVLFLASLGTCAGYFALRFCQERDLPTEGLRLNMAVERDEESRRLEKVRMVIHLPAQFPEKYRKAIVRATDQCAVKKAIFDPPEVSVTTE